MSSRKRCCIEEKRQPTDDDTDMKRVVINTLSLDSLAQIFMLLPISERIAIEQVCYKWKEACQLAWHDIKKYKCGKSIHLTYDNQLLTQEYVKKILLRCGKYLRELTLSKVCDSSIMPVVGYHCKNLTKLEFKFDMNLLINDANHFVHAFTKLDKLESIKIIIIGYNSKHNFPSKIIDSLSEEIKEIHLIFHLYLFPVMETQKNILLFDLKKFKNLQSLTLIQCNIDNIIQDLSEKKTLVNLDLRLFAMSKDVLIFNKLVNLEQIYIYLYSMLMSQRSHSDVFNSIVGTCKNIKHLMINNNCIDVNIIARENWKNLKNLEHLDIPCNSINKLAVKIVNYCKNLKHINLTSLTFAGIDDNIYDIEDGIKKLIELKNLESLNLDCVLLHDKSIKAIANNLKKLKKLVISACQIFQCIIIDEEEYCNPIVLDELSKLQYLDYLDIFEIHPHQDSNIIAIANKCKYLEYLNIGCCENFTDTTVNALVSLKNLKYLIVSGNLYITDDFIINLKGLKHLICSYCANITDVGVIQVIKNCPDLELLDVQSINNITIHTIITADNLTKNRKNDIILKLITSNQLKEDSQFIIQSHWLSWNDEYYLHNDL